MVCGISSIFSKIYTHTCRIHRMLLGDCLWYYRMKWGVSCMLYAVKRCVGILLPYNIYFKITNHFDIMYVHFFRFRLYSTPINLYHLYTLLRSNILQKWILNYHHKYRIIHVCMHAFLLLPLYNVQEFFEPLLCIIGRVKDQHPCILGLNHYINLEIAVCL